MLKPFGINERFDFFTEFEVVSIVFEGGIMIFIFYFNFILIVKDFLRLHFDITFVCFFVIDEDWVTI